ncbi:Uncharacterised protein [Mycobacteroides abscessus subsp. bolletii]|uniref:hypothetical protein n=1 Tax=Mycobacteroides abscessus TaxID=36809 RepID=UPI00092BF006|nr:hypothetical protein [Mycobacteroides abscessus]SHQ36046.1 Uncharacterised protein [Mycobacteroides abscessus subsp. bolletii]SHS10696.1 Uncharacterised protein [Mycobacteroides abscessus subsp. bolletii]SHS80438.1 Uncharacterised protein [Mycobacteroides abscessus subsp. bolletii]SHS84178.1 Uncharacterised protein [Mycobacteroides abscessus subsp. bolletii]SHX73844.1 Uncharacterised protein [Mycobacteroides abscessus subsp. bolletii]
MNNVITAAASTPASMGEWVIVVMPFAAVVFGFLTAFVSWRNNVASSKRDETLKITLRSSLDYNNQHMSQLISMYHSTTLRMDGLGNELRSLVVAVSRRPPP